MKCYSLQGDKSKLVKCILAMLTKNIFSLTHLNGSRRCCLKNRLWHHVNIKMIAQSVNVEKGDVSLGHHMNSGVHGCVAVCSTSQGHLQKT